MSQITISVKGLPSLGKGEAYSCFFQDTQTRATLTTTGVVCPTPDANSLPPIDYGDGTYVVMIVHSKAKTTFFRSQKQKLSQQITYLFSYRICGIDPLVAFYECDRGRDRIYLLQLHPGSAAVWTPPVSKQI